MDKQMNLVLGTVVGAAVGATVPYSRLLPNQHYEQMSVVSRS
ncbi:hypothetical protein SAMN05192533_11220 [Mesobacillus persicus]|uniref:Uncharacterized protein n=1 Tax=Mesobacillus persicus TaxID=930146 RepID=A0A1H8FYP2_9BACI|nr:hypothetical protein [Mesobacillus persicus]SEN36961.1 hypothetical protein SAMN05192533_11220 [Mesobacillus persicus]